MNIVGIRMGKEIKEKNLNENNLVRFYNSIMVDSLRYLSSRKAATALVLTKGDLSRLPLDVHDDLRRHLNEQTQIKLWDGEFKWWYDNGQLREYSWFNKDNKLDGENKLWYRNGQLEYHRQYKDNLLNGEYREWYENGRLFKHCWYKDGTTFEFCQVAQ